MAIQNIISKISSDELINQIADTLAEVDVDFLCTIADSVLSAKHQAVGMTPDGYDIIEQKYQECSETRERGVDLPRWRS
jgi:hypothetical protein|tara:strand:+ start:26416 stop:26652 length:237 start_codon:yes stop_codon:yes gene_type:complete